MAALNKTIEDGTVIWKVVKRVPDPPVYTAESLNVYTKNDVYTKAQIDSLLNKYLLKTGGTISGSLSITSSLGVSGSATISGNATVGGKLTMGSLVVPSAQGSGNFWIA